MSKADRRARAVDIAVCVDCIMLLANGETTEGTDADEHAAAMDRIWGDIELVPAGGDEDIEPHFSWRACDGCGSGLGGDRFAAAYFLYV